MDDLIVIGLAGRFGTGKDYLTREFFFPRGYRQWSLAWHFKVWVVGQGKATHEEVFHTKPERVRHLLQEEGTELGRDVYGKDIWVDTTFEWIQVIQDVWDCNKFIIPDVRFVNEAKAIQDRGGYVIRIHAPNRNADAPYPEYLRNHSSETDLDDFKEFDFVVDNDYDNADAVPNMMNGILDTIETRIRR